MIATNGIEYRLTDTTWGKYDSGFHAWLVETVDPDESDGDTDFGGIVRYGRRLDYWTSQGLHSLETCETEQEAQETFQAWSDEFNAPEIEAVTDARDVGYIVRTHWQDWMQTDNEVLSHPDFPGVALRIYSPGIVRTAYRWDEIEYSSDPDTAWVVMVGDDQLHMVDRPDLTPLTDEDYCPECGQVGCGGGF